MPWARMSLDRYFDTPDEPDEVSAEEWALECGDEMYELLDLDEIDERYEGM